MVAKLQAKPGGECIQVTLGDFTSLDGLPGVPFQLVFCVFSTLFALTSQEDQVRCFRAVASVLAPGGIFALEMFVPDPARFALRQPALVRSVEDDGITLEGCEHDAPNQRVHSRVATIRPGSVTVLPIELRYIWPAELDLMAQLAGLCRKERWADWERRPPAAGDPMQISVYHKLF
jgi:hypothetical protein